MRLHDIDFEVLNEGQVARLSTIARATKRGSTTSGLPMRKARDQPEVDYTEHDVNNTSTGYPSQDIIPISFFCSAARGHLYHTRP
jgi:hypothetical protein